jgi:hypothetical protein
MPEPGKRFHPQSPANPASSHTAGAASRASQPLLDLIHSPAPSPALAELDDVPGINDDDATAAPALHLEHVAMAPVVADRLETLAAHGLRLIDQTSAENEVMSAAIARTAAGSRMSIFTSESRRPPMFTNCSK